MIPSCSNAGAASVATKIYAAAVGKPIPSINEAIIVNNNAKNMLPPDNDITRDENFNPRPVKVIIPIIIPAQAQAVATGITASTPFSIVRIIFLGVSQVALLK